MIFNQYLNASPERYFDTADQPLYAERGQRRPEGLGHRGEARSRPRSPGTCRSPPTRTPAGSPARWPVTSRRCGGPRSWPTPPPTRRGSGGWPTSRSRPGNSGGSFLAVPATCKDPEAAFAFLSWLTTPQNQAVTFNDVQLFPSTPASFTGGADDQRHRLLRSARTRSTSSPGRRVRARPHSSAPTRRRPAPSPPSSPTSRPAARTPSRPGTRPSTQTDKILAKRGVL